MATRALLLLLGLSPLLALACSSCRAYVEAGIFDGSFGVKLVVMTTPVLIVVIGALILYLWEGQGISQ